ncbi:hypothetical protein GALL_39490 [mine drainage metagenome]|uniref:Uncharacterized protein n=1 Tax=mine drainage metagenome TaxID=410659 RepID=A0A1J5T3Z8_9ZZZZ
MRSLQLFVLFVLFSTSHLVQALPDELEVQLDELNRPGEYRVDVISSYTISGSNKPAAEGLRPTFHLLQASPDISYGITKDTQIDFQLYSTVGLNGEARADGGRIGLLTIPIRPDNEDVDGLFLGGLFEAGRLPATLSTNNLDAEFKLVLGYRTGRLTVAANPEIGSMISGNGSSQLDSAAKFKIAYQVDPSYSLGIEHYGDLGPISHIGPLNQQSQQTFAVVDMKAKNMDLNIGIGHGWNDFSERWVVKTVVSLPLGK